MEWPKCSVCKTKIESGEVFVVDEYEPQGRFISVAHDRCARGSKAKPRRMNEARAWAVREYSTVRDSASASA